MGERSISVRNLKVIIERDYQLTLDKAKFDIKAPLQPMPCVICPKNTAFNPLLPAAAKPTCTDKVCWRGKMRQHVEAQARELGKKANSKELVQITLSHNASKGIVERAGWKTAKPGECKNVQPATQVDEDFNGIKHFTIAKTVCTNKACKVHFGAAPSRSSSSSSGYSSTPSAPKKPATLEELRKENAEELTAYLSDRAMEEFARRALAKVDKLGEKEMRQLAADQLDNCSWLPGPTLAAVLGREKPTQADPWKLVKDAKVSELPRLLMALFFSRDIDEAEPSAEFAQFGKVRGVDFDKVATELKAKVEKCVICGCFDKHGCQLGNGKRCAWVVDDRLKKVGRVCSNPLCVAEAKKRAGVKDAPAKKSVQASAKPKAKGAKAGRA
jgi:hypothetical protein